MTKKLFIVFQFSPFSKSNFLFCWQVGLCFFIEFFKNKTKRSKQSSLMLMRRFIYQQKMIRKKEKERERAKRSLKLESEKDSFTSFFILFLFLFSFYLKKMASKFEKNWSLTYHRKFFWKIKTNTFWKKRWTKSKWKAQKRVCIWCEFKNE